MSFNMLTFNFIKDLNVVFRFSRRRRRRRLSVGEITRAIVAAGLMICFILIVIGFGIAGSSAAFDETPPVMDSLMGFFVGTGVGMAIPFGAVYVLMGAARKRDDD